MPQANSTTSMPRWTSPTRVVMGLAVLGARSPRRCSSAFLSSSSLKRNMSARALQRRHVGPGGERRLGRGDRGVELGRGRQRQHRRLLAGRRIEDRRRARAGRARELAADRVRNGLHRRSPCVAWNIVPFWSNGTSVPLVERLAGCRASVSNSSSICGLLDDQRRRQRDDVAGGADQEALLEGLEEGREGALGRLRRRSARVRSRRSGRDCGCR